LKTLNNNEWLSVAVGLVIEVTQFVLDLAIGGAYRTADANDVLFNAIGTLLGYGIFRVFTYLYIMLTQRFGTSPGRLPSYLYESACRVQTARSPE